MSTGTRSAALKVADERAEAQAFVSRMQKTGAGGMSDDLLGDRTEEEMAPAGVAWVAMTIKPALISSAIRMISLAAWPWPMIASALIPAGMRALTIRGSSSMESLWTMAFNSGTSKEMFGSDGLGGRTARTCTTASSAWNSLARSMAAFQTLVGRLAEIRGDEDFFDRKHAEVLSFGVSSLAGRMYHSEFECVN